MGSSEDDFTPLSELTVGMNKCRVRVRVSRLWESFNPKNDISFGLDCLLIDDEAKLNTKWLITFLATNVKLPSFEFSIH